MAIWLALGGYMFVGALLNYKQALLQYSAYGVQQLPLSDFVMLPLLSNVAVLLLLIMPVLTMGTLAGEKRAGSWPALATSAITPGAIVLGKFFGLLLFLWLLLGLLVLLPLSLLPFARLDWGQVAAGMLGLGLLSSAFCALGIATSAHTDNPAMAALFAFALLLLLWIIGWMAGSAEAGWQQLLLHLSLMNRLQNFLEGTLRLWDLLYLLGLSGFALYLATLRLHLQRVWGG
ncbi:ABC transporter, permease protein, putative [Magnetococcus marinus MC-1]|uniref:ABC transporter, permease protein, putative n=2 Tax=Magnetococcus TaxID=162171 RepID=A0L6B5_MAGMM|nr:ABC transporter permease [Magnetococcus marinus]ABK43508.1 ABC transporter, permease protein, putative [Magnetococcus marinus MC-1]